MNNSKRRRLKDSLARYTISIGGGATILVILALFVFIFIEVYPLFKDVTVTKKISYKLKTDVIAVGIGEYQEVSYVVYKTGDIEFLSLSSRDVVKRYPLENLRGAGITSVDKYRDRIVLGTDDGRILSVSVRLSAIFQEGVRNIHPEVAEGEVVLLYDKGMEIAGSFPYLITSRSAGDASVTAVYTNDNRLLLVSSETTTTLFGPEEKREFRRDITGLINHQHTDFREIQHNVPPTVNSGMHSADKAHGIKITAMALDLFMENLYVGTSDGEVFHIDVRQREAPVLVERVKVSDSAVTALGFLLGDVSLVIGDSRGGVSVWMKVRDGSASSGWVLKKVHTLESHQASVRAIVSSRRGKGFVTAASDGTIHLNHATSGQTLLSLDTGVTPVALGFSPKTDGILMADSLHHLFHWKISNPHPETTFKTLFGKVWYEGYEEPEYVWQSTGGTDDFEPKLSLVPLIFGTIKGTFYALIIAVPIGTIGALYTSQFLHSSLRIIKPIIEIMAALPSVILGFLAGLWLAPLMERIFPALVIMPLMILASVFAAHFLWKILPASVKGRYNHGIEVLVLIPFIILAVYVSLHLGGAFESLAFGGDYRQWLLNVLGLQYDQRNAVVVGFAMGFAVIPLVFTISEDAMSNVPSSLISASLAVGATPWQTAVRIVLPAASPAIFSAIMIGFGRTVGETMIVLMATGNTPIMDWNLFNGFRALAANIAVEIPEAPVGGTLYRVLFLASLLLFVTTFIVNTVAEVIRQRMKRKYGKL
ncbi:MAG: ABC transporter permease subunit [Candidatus Brocadiaceae bacterium]|nr:ABC transporter permease subunit [Candidatus Brocadiaceae bacterium]